MQKALRKFLCKTISWFREDLCETISQFQEKPFITLLSTSFVLLFVVLLGVLFSDGFSEEIVKLLGVKEKPQAIQFIGLAIGGILLILQVINSNKRANAIEKTADEQVKSNQQEQFKNAIEHLGHEKMSVRVAAVYELIALAKNDENFRKTAFEILCSHIRQTTTETAYQNDYKNSPSEEIQTLIDLLFRNEEPRKVFSEFRANLARCYFVGANMQEVNLQKANLRNANMRGADLQYANMQEAILFNAKMQGAVLLSANMQGAVLLSANMQEAILQHANMQGASLLSANIQGAGLQMANIQGAVLQYANMQGADLQHANMQGVDLQYANMQGADLQHANMQGADLQYANMQGATLFNAKMQGATLQYANMRGGNSQKANLPFVGRIQSQVEKATDLEGIFFSGGVTEKEVNDVCNILDQLEKGKSFRQQILDQLKKGNEKSKDFRQRMEKHIDKPAGFLSSEEIIEKFKINVGAYSPKEANEWIAEYEEATAPKNNDLSSE